MASYVYSITLKSTSPLSEDELIDALGVYSGNGDDVFKVLDFDLEDAEYADH